jgi:hypothetical protein
MRIGGALFLIAAGAILRFAIAVTFAHGIYLNVVGDILMAVGVLGLILWMAMWAPWARSRRTSYRRTGVVSDARYGPQVPPSQGYVREYEDEYEDR